MKKIIASTLLLASINASAFQIQAQCRFNRAEGECSVFNQWPQPMYCSLQAKGQVASGVWANVWENVTVYPGSYAYVYVNANNPSFDPLVYVTGFASCQF